MLRVVPEEGVRGEFSVDLDEICREGARRMLAAALEAERDAYLAALADERGEKGRRLVVGNGRANRRVIATGAGPVEVQAPRINDKRVDEETGERRRFRSQILAPWCRKSPKVSEVLPLMYLHGMSSGDFAPALGEFFGSDAGLSPSVVTRAHHCLAGRAGPVQPPVTGRGRLRVCLGGRHSFQRPPGGGTPVLPGHGGRPRRRDQGAGCHHRRLPGVDRILGRSPAGLQAAGHAAPVLAVGDGALGFWAALRDVFPETREQRCWVHVTANVLNALPTSVQPAARKALAEIRDAEDRAHAEAAIKAFEDAFGAKWPKAVAKITDKPGQLLAFYDFPAEHWIHLKTTNPIESTFATVRLRTKVTKGPGSKAAGLAMAYKLIDSAQARWRAVNAPHLVALVRAGAVFHNGVLVERHAEAVA